MEPVLDPDHPSDQPTHLEPGKEAQPLRSHHPHEDVDDRGHKRFGQENREPLMDPKPLRRRSGRAGSDHRPSGCRSPASQPRSRPYATLHLGEDNNRRKPRFCVGRKLPPALGADKTGERVDQSPEWDSETFELTSSVAGGPGRSTLVLRDVVGHAEIAGSEGPPLLGGNQTARGRRECPR